MHCKFSAYSRTVARSLILFYLLVVAYEGYNVLGRIGIPQSLLLAAKVGSLGICITFALLTFRSTLLKITFVDSFLLFFYLISVFMSSVFSLSPMYVLIYASMLLALLVFTYCISSNLFESQDFTGLKYLVVIFSLAVVVSIIGYRISPSRFSDIDVWGNHRVNGIFGEPSKLCQIAALNIFFVFYFVNKSLIKKVLKIVLIIFSLSAMILAGNRSYMLALVLICVSGLLIGWKTGILIKMVTVSLAVGSGIVLLLSLLPYFPHISYFRTESLSNLSGRTEMWKEVMPLALNKPLGSGYCLGGSTLVESAPGGREFIQRAETRFDMFGTTGGVKTTLHNGYIQALADLGYVGVIAYLLLFFRGTQFALYALKNPKMRIFICIFFFYAIVNMSATVLTGPTETNTLLFWICWFILMFNYRELKVGPLGLIGHLRRT